MWMVTYEDIEGCKHLQAFYWGEKDAAKKFAEAVGGYLWYSDEDLMEGEM